jgi:topoisomerase-4 subunit A
MTDPNRGDVVDQQLAAIIGEKYLAYALSTIMSRSLPDVRDGLKPVHRRVLYAMRELGLASNTPPRKSAQVVGSVIGKYHPHGDTAVYDALVRLAQDFSTRYPLVDGQGNFGNIDGDGAAAMRYTECRLTQIAEAMNRLSSRAAFPICSRTGPPASPSAWRLPSRRITPASWRTPC